MKSLGYVLKVDFCVNIDEGFCLFRLNVFFNIVLETLSKLKIEYRNGLFLMNCFKL